VDRVARGLGLRGHDHNLGAHQGIEERRLAHVRPAHQHGNARSIGSALFIRRASSFIHAVHHSRTLHACSTGILRGGRIFNLMSQMQRLRRSHDTHWAHGTVATLDLTLSRIRLVDKEGRLRVSDEGWRLLLRPLNSSAQETSAYRLYGVIALNLERAVGSSRRSLERTLKRTLRRHPYSDTLNRTAYSLTDHRLSMK